MSTKMGLGDSSGSKKSSPLSSSRQSTTPLKSSSPSPLNNSAQTSKGPLSNSAQTSKNSAQTSSGSNSKKSSPTPPVAQQQETPNISASSYGTHTSSQSNIKKNSTNPLEESEEINYERTPFDHSNSRYSNSNSNSTYPNNPQNVSSRSLYSVDVDPNNLVVQSDSNYGGVIQIQIEQREQREEITSSVEQGRPPKHVDDKDILIMFARKLSLSREETEKLLENEVIGTFIIRFSENSNSHVISYVTQELDVTHIAYIYVEANGKIRVHHTSELDEYYNSLPHYISYLREELKIIKSPHKNFSTVVS